MRYSLHFIEGLAVRTVGILFRVALPLQDGKILGKSIWFLKLSQQIKKRLNIYPTNIGAFHSTSQLFYMEFDSWWLKSCQQAIQNHTSN